MEIPSAVKTFMGMENKKARGRFCILHTENRIQVDTDMMHNHSI
jgi:hypothetical protein